MTFEDCICCNDAIWTYGEHNELKSISCGIGKKPSLESCQKEGDKK